MGRILVFFGSVIEPDRVGELHFSYQKPFTETNLSELSPEEFKRINAFMTVFVISLFVITFVLGVIVGLVIG